MAQQTINIGASPNDGTGTPLRTAFQYTNSNFSELYTALGGGSGLPGSSGQVIFNDGGTNLAGDTGLTFNKTTDTLGTGRLTTSGDAIVCSSTGDFYVGTTISPQFKVERATGAATITGDLTVDTSTLKVDSANDRVGIGTASPAVALDVVGAARFVAAAAGPKLSIENAGGSTRFKSTDTSSFYYSAYDHSFTNTDGSINRYTIDNNGVSTWYVSGSTAMTLNSTGLGVGGSPSSRLDVANSGTPVVFSMTLTGAQRWQQIIDTSFGNWTLRDQTGSKDVLIATAGTGNLGIGVTPSAWGAGYKALQLGDGLSLMGSTINGTIAANAWFDGTNWKYISANSSAQYYCSYFGNGSHVWTTSTGVPSAGGTVSYNQAMTLDASGNLLVGTTGVHLAAHSAFQNNAAGQVTFRNTSTTAGRYFNIGMNSGSSMLVVDDAGTGVYLDYGTTSWASTSDERLKDIIEPISNAVAKVGSLRSVIGKFKTDSEGTRRSFLIAQDVQSVLPEAVDTSNADAFGIRYTDVIPLLVAAIKELTAEVNALKNA